MHLSSARARRRAVLTAGAAAVAASSLGAPASAEAAATRIRIVDDRATEQTRALFQYLLDMQGQGIMFGHEHSLSDGFTFDAMDGHASDVEATTGDYPAVFGWDTLILNGFQKPGVYGGTVEENIEALTYALETSDARGGINVLSAHLYNFVTGGDFWDTGGRVVGEILPGGSKHADFNEFLDRIAAAVGGAVRSDGSPVPVVFRPFHENNGGWFWWGAGHCTSAEFIEIFRYTVEYLRDVKRVHNLLYSYSPGASFGGDPTNYLKTYPGDEFVDILGYDAYDGSAGSPEWFASTVEDLAMVVGLADERGKVPAFTEFGESGEEGRNPTWFTELLAALADDAAASRISHMLTWANFGGDNRAYVPYPGHPLEADFVAYHQDPYSLFASDLSGVFDSPTSPVVNPPFLHLVTPTDRQRVTTAETVIRVRTTGGRAKHVTYAVDGGDPVPLCLDDDGFYSATWSIDPSWLDNRSVTLSVTAKVKGKRHTDSALVLLGEVEPLPAGWVDDFEGYAGDDVSLSEAYSHVNANTTALSAEHKAGGSYGLAYSYDFASAGYTGIGKSVNADWTAFSTMGMWLQGDGSTNGATLQIVANGAYFEYNVPLGNTQGQQILAPFTEFAPAPWDTGHADEVLDAEHLANVATFNLYLGHGGGASTGTVYVDDIRAE
ncbi:glycosyl hydrolase [Glycomyces buryatensis]|uniref:Alpha-mannosidase n=1 Tax=Glycomyces buryatensis TaxID=2570927 RepID=A0A4S8QEW2_9ACTN|nr:glycosyl hydrolase [Glycomyces buryatensis]THV42948.1 alpha-mannosidase [Glycomyces buryatensis]